jgi:hypothetical protein
MNRYFSNISLILGIALAAVVVSVIASYVTCKWHWFGRSGAVITMAGVILSVRPLIRMGFAEWLKAQSIIDLGQIEPTPEEIEEQRQSKLDAKASNIGVDMALVGTLIWAYGDLIGGLP